jgi:hypothetical protein
MGVRVYLTQTSVPQGGVLYLHLADDTGAGADATVTITDVIGGTAMLTVPVHVDPHPVPADPAADHGWPRGAQVDIAADWPSAVYAVDVSPSNNPDRDRALFVVRAADPGHDAPISSPSRSPPTTHTPGWARPQVPPSTGTSSPTAPAGSACAGRHR